MAQQYIDIANNAYNVVKELALSDDGWEKLTVPSVKVNVFKRKATDWDGHIFKGTCRVKGSPDRVFDFCHPDTSYYKHMWDPNADYAKLIEELGGNILKVYSVSKPALGGLVSPRETYFVVRLDNSPNLMISAGASFDHEKDEVSMKAIDPSTKKADLHCAWGYPTGIIVQPSDVPEKSLVTAIFQSDFRGKMNMKAAEAALPMGIVEWFGALRKTHKLDYKPLVDVPGKRA